MGCVYMCICSFCFWNSSVLIDAIHWDPGCFESCWTVPLFRPFVSNYYTCWTRWHERRGRSRECWRTKRSSRREMIQKAVTGWWARNLWGRGEGWWGRGKGRWKHFTPMISEQTVKENHESEAKKEHIMIKFRKCEIAKLKDFYDFYSRFRDDADVIEFILEILFKDWIDKSLRQERSCIEESRELTDFLSMTDYVSMWKIRIGEQLTPTFSPPHFLYSSQTRLFTRIPTPLTS